MKYLKNVRFFNALASHYRLLSYNVCLFFTFPIVLSIAVYAAKSTRLLVQSIIDYIIQHITVICGYSTPEKGIKTSPPPSPSHTQHRYQSSFNCLKNMSRPISMAYSPEFRWCLQVIFHFHCSKYTHSIWSITWRFMSFFTENLRGTRSFTPFSML